MLKGIGSIIGAVAVDVGILTTPQLHWMVRASNRSTQASEFDYLEQLSRSFRLVSWLVFCRERIYVCDYGIWMRFKGNLCGLV